MRRGRKSPQQASISLETQRVAEAISVAIVEGYVLRAATAKAVFRTADRLRFDSLVTIFRWYLSGYAECQWSTGRRTYLLAPNFCARGVGRPPNHCRVVIDRNYSRDAEHNGLPFELPKQAPACLAEYGAPFLRKQPSGTGDVCGKHLERDGIINNINVLARVAESQAENISPGH